MENKMYRLDVMEKRTYCHDVVIQVEDDADIDAICNRIEEALNNPHGDIWNINYTTGVKVVDIFEDESPKYECKVLDYKELLMFSRMEARNCEEFESDINIGDAISRQQAIDGKIAIYQANGVEIYSDEAVPVNYLKNLPSIQPKSKEGYWIDKGWSGDWAWQTDGRGNCWRVIVCSECGKNVSTESNYCPNCGARMRKKIND